VVSLNHEPSESISLNHMPSEDDGNNSSVRRPVVVPHKADNSSKGYFSI
jgi:hypothetical protein